MRAIPRAWRVCIGNRRANLLAASYALEAQLAHQPLDPAADHLDPFAHQLLPHLVGSVNFEVRIIDALDLGTELRVTPGTARLRGRIGPLVGAPKAPAARRSFRSAVELRPHEIRRRLAQNLVDLPQLTVLPLPLLEPRQFGCRGARALASSLLLLRTDLRSVSGVQPTFTAIELAVAHSDSYVRRWSNTIRTARARISDEYFGCAFFFTLLSGLRFPCPPSLKG
ncbi:hypothetical protein WT25_05705 [Burkholderia territorii]|nr:hypothetical protein WT25_05705 [Burkholderia territorii]